MQHRPAAVLIEPRGDGRRTGLAVPQAKLGEVDAARILHRLDEILAGHRLAIVAVEIEVGAGAEAVRAEDGAHHADDFGALVVHRGGVEVGDLEIALGAYRMGERAGILGELRRTQHADVVDPLDRRRAHVGGEPLVAEDSEAFLEAELEPVTAGDSIARPIVEIFVRDDPGDGVEITVGRGVGVGQDVARIEDVEPLVLHRAEVEIVDRDDVEQVEVIFAAVGAFVPRH